MTRAARAAEGRIEGMVADEAGVSGEGVSEHARETVAFIVPAPGRYEYYARVLSAHYTIEAARAAARCSGVVARLGAKRKGDQWLRIYEPFYPILGGEEPDRGAMTLAEECESCGHVWPGRADRPCGDCGHPAVDCGGADNPPEREECR